MFLRMLRLMEGEGDPAGAGAGGDPERKPDGGEGGDPGADPGAGGGGDGGQGGDGGGGGDPQPITMEQFRAQASAGDEKVAKALERYTDPQSVAKALIEAKTRISEGFKPEPYPEKGTDDEKAAWRDKNDVPAEAAAYVTSLPDGFVVGDEDKPAYDFFAGIAHEANIPQSAFDVFAAGYAKWEEQLDAQLVEMDDTHKAELDDLLAADYGPAEYRANKQGMIDFLNAQFPKETVDEILNARLPDGRGLFNNEHVVRSFIKIARLHNPAPHLVGGEGDPMVSITGRLKEIDAMRKKDYEAYMRNEEIQKEERELLDAKQKLDEQGKAA